jgi:hypothetical protein
VNTSGFGTGIETNGTVSTNGGANGAASAATSNGANAAASAGSGGTLSSDIGTGAFYAYPAYGADMSGTTSSNGTAYGANGGANGSGGGGAIGAGNGGVSAGTTSGGYAGAAMATPEINSAVRREARKERATVERRGQMLYSITPRTHGDLSWQMPDDPVSPALSTPDRPAVRY